MVNDIQDIKKTKDMGKGLRILSNIGFLIFMTIISILIIMTLQSRLTGEEPRLLGYRVYIVDSGSMLPTIGVDSIILVRETSAKDILVGDIITYYGQDKSTRITHRVKEIVEEGQSFVTRGDANNSDDPNLLEGSKIIGRVVYILPVIGGIFRFLNTQAGIAFLVALSITWIALPMLVGRGRKNK